MKKRSIAILTSGGFDSNVLLVEFLRKRFEVHPLYIQSGLFWEKAEIHWLKKFLSALPPKFRKKIKPLTILEVPFLDLNKKSWFITGKEVPDLHSTDEKVYIPGRNLLLLSKAAIYCALHEIPKIAIGSLAANPFPDATPQFFQSFGKTSSLALGCRLRVLAPFLKVKKETLLKMGKDLPLRFSFSCLAPNGLKPCRSCNKCAEVEKIWC